MAAASWRGSIAFGPLIRFNVRAVAADKELKFPFNTHHAEDGGRLRSQRPVCEVCGEVVEKEAECRGYNGAYPVDESYLDALELERSSVMDLDGLVPAEQIEPRWYKRSYDVVPEKGAEQPYVLFLRLLETYGKVAIGKVVTGGKEAIVTVRPRDGVLAMELMWWPEEIKSNADAKAAIAGVEVSDSMLAVGGQLVTLMSRDFDPASYRNEWAEAMGTYLEELQSGTAVTPIEHRELPKVSTSLEDALAATLAAMGGAPAAEAAKPAGKKKGKAA